MNLIYRHPSGGKLWQGSRLSSGYVPTLDRARIKAVVFAAIEFQPALPDRFDVLRVRIYDDPLMDDYEAGQVAKCADEVSDMLVDYLSHGHNVLSSCFMGWNRSGLISALTIMKLTGLSVDAVVAHIRETRSFSALGNPRFVEILREYQ